MSKSWTPNYADGINVVCSSFQGRHCEDFRKFTYGIQFYFHVKWTKGLLNKTERYLLLDKFFSGRQPRRMNYTI